MPGSPPGRRRALLREGAWLTVQGPALRVVVVDNDRAVVDLLVLDLGLEGHDVVGTATDGPGAVDRCAIERPDVLVIDMKLGPGPSGLDVARQVRDPATRIILHTNYVTADVVRAARGLGVTVVEKGSLSTLRRAVADSRA